MTQTLTTGLSATWLRFKREVIVWEDERGLFYREGRFVRVLEPGRYLFGLWEKVRVVKVNTRQMSEVITGQDLLTAFRCTWLSAQEIYRRSRLGACRRRDHHHGGHPGFLSEHVTGTRQRLVEAAGFLYAGGPPADESDYLSRRFTAGRANQPAAQQPRKL